MHTVHCSWCILSLFEPRGMAVPFVLLPQPPTLAVGQEQARHCEECPTPWNCPPCLRPPVVCSQLGLNLAVFRAGY